MFSWESRGMVCIACTCASVTILLAPFIIGLSYDHPWVGSYSLVARQQPTHWSILNIRYDTHYTSSYSIMSIQSWLHNKINDHNYCGHSDENPHHLCLVSYRMPSDYVPVVAPHGNSKSLTPFFQPYQVRKRKLEISVAQVDPSM